MHLTQYSKSELTWWIQNIDAEYKYITVGSPDVTLTTDASTKGWGAVLEESKTGGLWDKDEQTFHINYLELKAVSLGLQSLCGNITHKHIRILSDNTTTISYIMLWEASNPKFVMIWHTLFGVGVQRGISG